MLEQPSGVPVWGPEAARRSFDTRSNGRRLCWACFWPVYQKSSVVFFFKALLGQPPTLKPKYHAGDISTLSPLWVLGLSTKD